jgi:hypothetical protein
MFDPKGKSTGTSYTATVALLSVALIFIPVLLLASSPVGYGILSFAAAASMVFLALAWFSWKRASQMSIPTITGGRAERR